ncbi:GNAT family N-acetyltransferase [Zavarzinella formosa]|uniref:GNAT family N-acetyltransferase n=1 Tax=Zavarzinella formosa TaxID=360055 RepID=UPI000907A5A8
MLVRLTVDRRHQNQGIGHMLQVSCGRRCKWPIWREQWPCWEDVLSEKASRFYQSCGFVELPSQPSTLCLMFHITRPTGPLSV